MSEENKETKEQLDKLIKAVNALSGEIISVEKRMEKMEQKQPSKASSLEFVSLVQDTPPKPPSFYDRETIQKAIKDNASSEVFDQNKDLTNGSTEKLEKQPENESMESEIGIKWFGRIGIFALVIGISFFLKYSFDNNWIPEVGRVVLGILAGLTLVILGERSREKYIQYASILTGGGVAVLYLSIYAAFAYYNLIDQTVAFAAMGAVTFAAGVLAIYYNKAGLAALAVLGGFITPVLLSTGTNNQVGLFIYITLLNLGILGISFFRNWHGLNLLGFIGTMILFLGWRAEYFTQDQLFLTMIFLVVTFMVYAVSTISHNIIEENKTEEIDAAMVTLNAISFFAISYSLLNVNYPEYMGFFAVLMAFVYFVFASAAFRFSPNDKYLAMFLTILSAFFLVIAAPIQFDGYWVTIAWLLDAVILMKVGFILPGSGMRSFGWGVFILAIARLVFIDIQINDLKSYDIILNVRFLAFIIGVVATSCVYYLYSRDERSENRESAETVKKATLFLANLLLLLILSSEIGAYFDKKIQAIPFTAYPDCYSSYNSRYGDSYDSPSCKAQLEQYAKDRQDQATKTTEIKNSENVSLSVLWAIYAIMLLAFGFSMKNRLLRLMGMGLFGITILKLFFIDLWYLGTLYRIISSMVLGVILLLASFGYSKYKDRIKEII